MFERLRKYRLRKNLHGLYARKQMNKAAKKAGFTYAARHGGAFYIDVMRADNIKGKAVRIIHYLHTSCDHVGWANETCCVALLPDGEILVSTHMVGECPKCLYMNWPTPDRVIRIREARSRIRSGRPGRGLRGW